MKVRAIAVLFGGLGLLGLGCNMIATWNAGAVAAETHAHLEAPPEILPLVVIKPGETQVLSMTTFCTVGSTRGGGFSLSEIVDGKPVAGKSAAGLDISYSRDGIEVTIPGWSKAVDFSNLPKFAALKEQNLQAFEVTVKASADSKPGLINMHIADSTCNGDCHTNFRILVLPKQAEAE